MAVSRNDSKKAGTPTGVKNTFQKTGKQCMWPAKWPNPHTAC